MHITKQTNEVNIILPKDFAIKEAGEFRDAAYKLLEEGSLHFILDFKNCEFIDSSGLGVMVSLYKRCAEKRGSMKVFNLKPQVLKVFQLTRLDKVFEI